MKKTTFLPLTVILLLLSLSVSGCAKDPALPVFNSGKASVVPVSASGLYFDTVITVTLYEYEGSSDDLFDECMDICGYYESLFSPTVEGSDIYRINHASVLPDDPGIMRGPDESLTISIDPETADLINISLNYSEMSGGAFDITAGVLIDLWDIKENSLSEHPVIPGNNDIEEALSHTDYRKISINTSPPGSLSGKAGNDEPADDTGTYTITLADPETKISLGAVAKGYVADRLCGHLTKRGVKSALINLGGNVVTLGSKPDGNGFKIGIQKPFADSGEPMFFVNVSDRSVVSSGIYERYYEKDGHIYHHIIDTKKGYPTDNGVLGVSVISSSSVSADALSTVCLLLGPEEGLKLIESTDDTEAVYIMDDYSTIQSSGFGEYMITP